MRSRLRGARSAWTLAALAFGVLPAAAADVVIMPFSCHVAGGKPVLAPSDDQAHRIYGTREQRKVKTCSPVDQKRCRQWTTFKFEMDCGGERVSWMQVYANAGSHTRRRVSESNGRLRVADTPRRSKRIDDMCARRMGSNMDWWSVDELCEEASPLNAPTSTEMPVGFAPMVGLDASILPEEALRSSSLRLALDTSAERAATESEKPPEPAAPSADARPVPASEALPESTPDSTKFLPPPEPRAAEPAPAPSEAVAQVEAATPQSPTAVQPDSPPVTVLNSTPADATHRAQTSNEMAKASPSTASQAAAAAARSDGLPPAATPASTSEPSIVTPAESSASPAPTASETVVAKADDDVRPQTTAAQAAHPPIQAPSPEGSPQTTGSIGETQSASDLANSVAAPASGPDTSATLSFAIAAFVTAALVITGLVLNWLYRAPAQPPALRNDKSESSPASMADVVTRKEGAPYPGGSLVPVTMHAHHPAPALAVRTGDRIALSDRIPVNKPEALAVLGMGVSAEGNLASLKKIIDGLRMNWHPDLARDDADRHLRELRLKQINAAWEILGDKRAQA